MEVLYRAVLNISNKIYRYAFLNHPDGHAHFSELDDLLAQKENFISFIISEYTLGIFYNIIISLMTLYYAIRNRELLNTSDSLAFVWMLIVTSIKMFEVIPKVIILLQTKRISEQINSQNSDPIICARRLMYMTRSNIYYYNAYLTYFNFSFYAIYFFLSKTNTASENPEIKMFYLILKLLIFGYFFKIIVSFGNYFFHFKVDINEADIQNSELYMDYTTRASNELINMIGCKKLDKLSIRKLSSNKKDDCEINEDLEINQDENSKVECCICILGFNENDEVRILPCNDSHIFHKICIDKWLKQNKNCPTCRKEINKFALKSKLN